MICQIRDADDTTVERYEMTPECGTDFCAYCGDCLHCYGGDPCPDSKSKRHRWVLYHDIDGHTGKIERVRAQGRKL